MPENLSGDINVKNTNYVSQTNEEESSENDANFKPVISLPVIKVSNNEEDEAEMVKLRAKLYRYDTSSNPAEWKERGTGEIKLLRHKTKHTVRVVMRRDKTLKICANHFVTPWMELKPNCGSDRAWVWSVLADYADEQLKPELLAIRFANVENATIWKEAFEKAKKIVVSQCELYAGKTNLQQKCIESNNEVNFDSDVSNSGSTSNENQTKLSKQTEEDEKEIQKDAIKNNEENESVEEITNDITKLKVKNEDKKKNEK
ncbi:ran-specific GTPase-activating protein-like [Pseudomyrmex gracilis]|uniref:ran-specific GTPase-activating protein-like n=1 Tax=Pseudomyrmex gracilis TaxID=219809 RepID=UPI00099500B2|nr:ran-specific GTPase-activating protein-like [Pseudomyrmex gracilis]